ncbi:hypothetical protein DMC30DRAFT_55835 [Rhodotorula diobovata]|uniref:Secreted protein n=1 Tax=Rhodotorula diobovata TaxID=5288 RepID=A0A5C5G3L5_9BASI|nr:hypothetical protein DMC30DRAFT_55835 [Rhodotorula diobovata]
MQLHRLPLLALLALAHAPSERATGLPRRPELGLARYWSTLAAPPSAALPNLKSASCSSALQAPLAHADAWTAAHVNRGLSPLATARAPC